LVFAKLNTIIINFPDLDQTHLTSFDAAAESGLKFCLRFLFIIFKLTIFVRPIISTPTGSSGTV